MRSIIRTTYIRADQERGVGVGMGGGGGGGGGGAGLSSQRRKKNVFKI